MKANASKVDAKINSLKPGQSVEISRNGETWVTVERSGSGEILRWVRHTANTDQVFKKMDWNQF